MTWMTLTSVFKFCKVSNAEFMHNISYISCDNSLFLSMSLTHWINTALDTRQYSQILFWGHTRPRYCVLVLQVISDLYRAIELLNVHCIFPLKIYIVPPPPHSGQVTTGLYKIICRSSKYFTFTYFQVQHRLLKGVRWFRFQWPLKVMTCALRWWVKKVRYLIPSCQLVSYMNSHIICCLFYLQSLLPPPPPLLPRVMWGKSGG